MKKRLACAGALAATAALSNGKEVITADGRKVRRKEPSQKIKLGINEDLCIFENFDDKWCLQATPPQLKAGWEWKQTFTTSTTNKIEYYQLELQPFIQAQLNIISELLLQNYWVNNVAFDVDQFKSNLFISIIWNENFKLCPGIGYDTEKVLLRILYDMKFWNCEKTIISDLKDYSSTWTGYDAKYFENCTQSEMEQVIVYEKTVFAAQQDQVWLGTVDPESVKYCLGLFGTSASGLVGEDASRQENDPAILLAKMAYKTFFNWAVTAYPEAFI